MRGEALTESQHDLTGSSQHLGLPQAQGRSGTGSSVQDACLRIWLGRGLREQGPGLSWWAEPYGWATVLSTPIDKLLGQFTFHRSEWPPFPTRFTHSQHYLQSDG